MSDQEETPDRLGPYRLLDRIGEGGMGVVFLARDPGQRPVALKVLRAGVAGEPTARRRLAREVETMRRVRSPHVAEVVDADLTGEMPFIVTRYVPGRTLDDVVGADGPLRGDALAKLARGLADALVAVHAAGVVHRDLKPGNVMLVNGSPVVIDFGIAQGADTTRLTMTGMFMGTPGYLSPEVIEGHPSSEASDVHAWAATVAFAATGRPPFGAGPYETVFYRIVNGQVDLAGAPLTLTPLLAAALDKDPSRRPTALALSEQAAALDPASLTPAPPAVSAIPGGAPPGAVPGGAGGQAATRADRAQEGAVRGGAVHGGMPAAAAMPVDGAPAQPRGSPSPAVLPGGRPPGPPQAGFLAPNAPSAGLAAPNAESPASPAGDGHWPAPAAPAHPGWLPAVSVGPDGLPPDGTRPFPDPRPADDFSDLLPPAPYHPSMEPPPGAAGPGAPAAAGSAGARASSQPVGERSRAALVAAALVLAAGVSVILPVVGTATALALIVALRAGELAHTASVRRRVRGPRRGGAFVAAVSFPWFVARSILSCLLLAPFALAAAAVAGGISIAAAPGHPLSRALAFAAGALVAFYGIGPGSSRSRRQLGRLLVPPTRSRFAGAVALAGMLVLAAAALAAAATWPSFYWPAAPPARLGHVGAGVGGTWRHVGVVAHYLLGYLRGR